MMKPKNQMSSRKAATGNGRNGKPKARPVLKPTPNMPQTNGDAANGTDSSVASICEELQRLQRQRVSLIKTRVMITNRLVSSVAVVMGYSSGATEDDREAKFEASRQLIKQIKAGDERPVEIESPYAVTGLVLQTDIGLQGFVDQEDVIEKAMIKLAKRLPIAKWAAKIKGFGIDGSSLATLIGETGDLANYDNPGKVWRRMGCAPFESNGKMRMGSSWRMFPKGGKLSAEEWEEYGYSPRRRAIAYVIGENLVKLNGDGPYRRRYDQAKELKLRLESDEWPRQRCHRHGMLLAVKRLMRDLWVQWNPGRAEH